MSRRISSYVTPMFLDSGLELPFETLKDEHTYTRLIKNPSTTLEKDTNSLLKGWLKKKHISKETYLALHCSDTSLPKAYGLPKIHKKDVPLRIIVSSVNSAVNPLATFLHEIISKSTTPTNSHVTNSFDLYKTLTGKEIGESDNLISLDVISLFTNVPVDLALDGISSRWNEIEKNTTIPFEEFMSAIKFVLTSTFFTFNDVIYKQTYGTPTGSSSSPVIAELVMRDLENKALGAINLELPFYYRYVDDIILAAPSTCISKILDVFNSLHPRLQFTVEYENNRSLSFLDLLLRVVDNRVVVDWYHKSTFSGRYLSFFSNHPMCHKIGTIYGLVDRAIMLSHPSYQQKNLEFCVGLLLDNGYPLELIFKTINSRLKNIERSLTHDADCGTNSNSTPQDRENKFAVIPFIRGVSERVAPLIRRTSHTVGFRCLNNLNPIRAHKDKTEFFAKNNVVYKINCKDCDASYVGERHTSGRVPGVGFLKVVFGPLPVRGQDRLLWELLHFPEPTQDGGQFICRLGDVHGHPKRTKPRWRAAPSLRPTQRL
ncbi:PREDICTED: uncharacterized protein LOC105461126 [Wasmannia auropunctata]|uniref:uncharacterized protein LOC105461126 n=1 Tax=Wasmannia auropunctata TaxID=64793 RepID=UPI0005F0159F|nr:PREDICTED: uncharacterized protein LOC105461126 [Wasmannia auropunctata]